LEKRQHDINTRQSYHNQFTSSPDTLLDSVFLNYQNIVRDAVTDCSIARISFTLVTSHCQFKNCSFVSLIDQLQHA